MANRGLRFWAIGYAIVFLILFVIGIALSRQWLVEAENARLIAVAKDIASILGLAGVAIAAATFVSNERERQRDARQLEEQRREERRLERVKISIDLMSRFYAPENLEDIRRALREHYALERPDGHPHSLRWDEVWVMNFFETLAVGIREGLLDIKLVNYLFGSPILEVAENPILARLADPRNEDQYSYEGYTEELYRPICRIRGFKPRF